ncbi:MAG: YgfZ/GcvT domain-containing protein [Halocynthiibacter sp.]
MERRIFEIHGEDRHKFLDNLVTNRVPGTAGDISYAALLTPQGKYLSDFFLIGCHDHILIDLDAAQADATIARLNMYRLRADVDIRESTLRLGRGLGTAPDGALEDPRHPDLGWRHYDVVPQENHVNWPAIYVTHLIPQSGTDLISDDSYILECGFERLNGVDFKKGCYVGQEVTARMKHKTTLRKGLTRVEGSAPLTSGEAITRNGKTIGKIGTTHNTEAIAYLRFDQMGDEMMAGHIQITGQNQT